MLLGPHMQTLQILIRTETVMTLVRLDLLLSRILI